jgi:hypothetical protein
MGGACSTYGGGDERRIQGFGGETGKEDPGVDVRIIFKMDLQDVGCKGSSWLRIGTYGGHL